MSDTLSDFHLERLGSHDGHLTSIPLRIGANKIGRLPTNNIVLSSKYASRSHCTIYVTETDQITLKNDVTTNGVFINGTQKLHRDAEICLNIGDCLGIGCDTSNEEILDAECFIFKIKRNKIEANDTDDIILLDDSDEEEYKIQEEYSQMNISEMKQEYMELEDFVEELNSIKNESDVEYVLIESPSANVEETNGKMDVNDVLEEIIANSSKSFAEKTELIRNVVPDVRFLLSKDCHHTESNEIEEIKEQQIERQTEEDLNADKDESDQSLQPPNIKERRFTIQLTNISPVIPLKLKPSSSSAAIVEKVSLPSPVEKQYQNDSSKSVEKESKTLEGTKILNRRNSFVPSSTLSKGPTKRPLEIINAPYMLKRRKSVSIMHEKVTSTPKANKADSKWLLKKDQCKQKRRSKEELKSKLAALVPDPKDKIIEPKTIRTNTKIPVKNTHKTRSDQLTDTIVKANKTPACKHKVNETSVHIEPSKKLRSTEHEITKDKPKEIQARRTSIAEGVVKRNTDVEQTKVSECNRKPIPNDQPTFDLNKNNGSTAAATSTPTSPSVKSILKKSNSIQKRRATVTFAEESRIKAVNIIPPAVQPPVRSEEENVDDVIHNIMSLGMSALKESCSATINGKNFSYKTVAHEYVSLQHLQNVFIPLMKAELWKEIEDGYARLRNTSATNVQLNYCMRDENYPNRFKYHCETHSSAAIQNGALVMMMGITSGKEFLGYIINRQITNKICYFQFVTPCSMQQPGPTLLKLKQIMYIRPNLKVFEALFKLKNSPLIKHILHPRDNCTKPQKQQFKYKGYNSLNQDQMITLSTVYRKCIGGQPFISLIEGPPGTGKSRLITNLVLQLLYGKEITQPLKILVCAPSNAAVDILTKNLMEARRKYSIEKGQKKMKLVRFGVLEKMDVSVRGFSIQGLTSHNEKMALIEQNKLMEFKKKKEAELAICTVREKICAIRKEIGVIENKIKSVIYDEKCLLEGANVICTTLNSCCALSSKISSMDICIIDEATQCNEPTSLIPLQFGVKSLILVGDTKQLPSTVLSEIAKQYNYDQSLFQRLQKSFESANEFENPILQLTIQYRMHPDILHWPNEYFYRNQLVTADTMKKSTLSLKPYTVFNLNYVQSAHTGQKHISNVDEAKFVRNLLDFLITKADPKSYSYGIISAYSQQKDDLAKVLSLTYPFVSVNTIDSCQGQERDIVIISIARTKGIGFLAIRQRLNVALTRAKKNVDISHPMWASFLDDARQRKLYVHLPTMDDSSLSPYFEKTLTA